MTDEIRVLHVDDEPDFADMAAEFIEREDDRLAVTTVTTASRGLVHLDDAVVDCVVSDYDMPGQNGIEFLEAVREDYPDLPFILYTGKGSEEVASDAFTLGATDYLQKGSGMGQYELLANRIRNAVDQYRSKQAVKTTHRRFQTLIKEATDVIIVMDIDGTYDYLSPAAERVLGYNPEELLGEPGIEYIHPDDRKETLEQFRSMVKDPQREPTAELRFDHKDGPWQWLEVRWRNLLDNPVIEGLVVYARDITEWKARENELRHVKEEYETVFSTAQDALFLFDVDEVDDAYEFRLRRLNPAHEAISGLSTEEDRGKTPVELLGEEDGAEVAARYQRCVDAREPISYEEELEMPTGTIHFQTKLCPVFTDGKVTQIVGVARDITDQVEHRIP